MGSREQARWCDSRSLGNRLNGVTPGLWGTGSVVWLPGSGEQAQWCDSRALGNRLSGVTLGLICSWVCGTFLNQGLNPSLLHWQTDSLPLSYVGSPNNLFNHTQLKMVLNSWAVQKQTVGPPWVREESQPGSCGPAATMENNPLLPGAHLFPTRALLLLLKPM